MQVKADKKEADRLKKAKDEALEKKLGILKTNDESVRSKYTRDDEDIRKLLNFELF
jgi:hypothetical protein